ncbi:MAG: asparagine synthase (glutamine-hydrolyzing) [Candidatus Hydrogenedentota bacterium]|nr:MAG: asparagine synthase (glutamine-hydrolyzing) [Candidatus Hydrogenedentota bacterium]
MCGICGIFHREPRPADEALLRAMSRTLIHRGPDGEGYRTFSHGGLGHRRLAIIDLAGGTQPMPNEDERVWVAFNGEIYNYRELRRGLEENGHAFRTHSDTEVLVHLFEDRREGLPRHLRGMFALAVWDDSKKILLLARDRIGKKPLFYYENDAGIFFASELKALRLLPHFPDEIDPEAVELYLAYQSIPGTRTIYRKVKRLAPGSLLTWSPGEPARIEEYWTPPWFRKTSLSYHDARRRLRELILDATRARLIADVPLGAFLSGGVDSSAVVAAMAETSSEPVKTFSIGFPERDFTETHYARIVAERFGTDHHEFIVEPEGIEILPKLVWHYDQPYADSSALPTYYVSKLTRRHVTVALNGDGGDEFFGGYDRYRALLFHNLYRALCPGPIRSLADTAAAVLPEGSANRSFVRRLRRFAHAGVRSPFAFNLSLFAFFDRAERLRLYSPDFLPSLGDYDADHYLLEILGPEPRDRFAALDRVLRADTLCYLPDTLLVKVDIASMAVSLEARSPLLDTAVMEFAASLPPRWKLGFRDSKKILKEAHNGILPEAILYRRKMGFGVPLSHWFRGDLAGYLEDTILAPNAAIERYFRPQAVRDLVREHRTGRRNNANRLWALLMLELWHRHVHSQNVKK